MISEKIQCFQFEIYSYREKVNITNKSSVANSDFIVSSSVIRSTKKNQNFSNFREMLSLFIYDECKAVLEKNPIFPRFLK